MNPTYVEEWIQFSIDYWGYRPETAVTIARLRALAEYCAWRENGGSREDGLARLAAESIEDPVIA